MSNSKNNFAGDLANLARGLLMGAADVVPGVSGGTMALILGHYERLISAISHIDRELLRLALARKWRAAAEHMDLRFLIGLALGIASGVLMLATLMHYLLEHHQPYTYAAFTGLILGSCYLVAQRLHRWRPTQLAWAALGAAIAVGICLAQPVTTPLTPTTAFFSACIAICAMILPGISGAFVLLLLGLYFPVTELIKGILHFEFAPNDLFIVACFVCGCLVGLIAFSRVLRWQLERRHDSTMAMLAGLMAGSLLKIWPFQQVTPETAGLEFKQQVFQRIWPSTSSASLVAVLAIILIAATATLLLDVFGNWTKKNASS